MEYHFHLIIKTKENILDSYFLIMEYLIKHSSSPPAPPSPWSFITPSLLPFKVFHNTVMRTWWTLITWPFALAQHWCPSQKYRIKCPARLMWMKLSKPSSSTMRLFSRTLKSWTALFMRNAWLETTTGKLKNVASFFPWKNYRRIGINFLRKRIDHKLPVLPTNRKEAAVGILEIN